MGLISSIMAGPKGTAMPEPYSLKDVAEELGLHPQTVKYHIYDSGYFKGMGKKVGRSLAFTQAELDRMRVLLKSMPPPGRKRKPAKK